MSNQRPRRASAAAAAPTLKQIQDSLQKAILDGDDAILTTILDNTRTSRETLFGVYRNAYVGRLVEILGTDYALLRAYVGDDYFAGLARAYILAHPSRTQNARWVGAKLPGFMANYAAEHPQLAELAAIEKAVSDAFDAADSPAIGLADMAAIPAESWTRLTFEPHPSVHRLDASTNAFALWTALKDERDPPSAEAIGAPEHVVVWRHDLAPMVRVMGGEEAMMWTEAARGLRFESLCELVGTYDDPDTAAARAAGYLHSWLTSDMLTAAKLSDAPAPRERRAAFDRPAGVSER